MQPITVLLATLDGSRIGTAPSVTPIVVLGVVHDVREAMAAVVEQLPDVIVLDRALLPGVTALAAAAWVRRHAPTSRLLIVAPDDDTTYETIVSGAFSVVDPAGELDVAAAAGECGRGESQLGPHAAHRLMSDLPMTADARDLFGTVRLTIVEHEILSRLARGASIDAIAEDHDVTPRLVRLHIGYAVAKRQLHAAQVLETAERAPYATGKLEVDVEG
jgi:DNA-binding NarL/FixJ family response regulator